LLVVLTPLFWIMPLRMGPHVTAVRWPGIIAAHLFWTIYGLGLCAVAVVAPRFGWVAYLTGYSAGSDMAVVPPPTLSQVFRSPPAIMVWGLAEVASTGEEMVLVIGAFFGVEAVILAAAFLLMPFAAHGEKFRVLN